MEPFEKSYASQLCLLKRVAARLVRGESAMNENIIL